uniref:BTB domain-containing protein n=1 Tax=Alexandrium catenella TaxID=2925 RepID=A0A7S1MQS0_ALECA
MLQYVYTGALLDSYDYAAMLVLADKYELVGLAQDCAAALLRSMCVDNAVTVMRTVKPYSDRMHLQPLWAGMRNVFWECLADDKVFDECVDSL